MLAYFPPKVEFLIFDTGPRQATCQLEETYLKNWLQFNIYLSAPAIEGFIAQNKRLGYSADRESKNLFVDRNKMCLVIDVDITY